MQESINILRKWLERNTTTTKIGSQYPRTIELSSNQTRATIPIISSQNVQNTVTTFF